MQLAKQEQLAKFQPVLKTSVLSTLGATLILWLSHSLFLSFSLMTILLSFLFISFLFVEIFWFFFCFILLEEISLEVLSEDVLLSDDVLISYELQDLSSFSSVQSVSYLLEHLFSLVLWILSLIFVLTNARVIVQAPYWLFLVVDYTNENEYLNKYW